MIRKRILFFVGLTIALFMVLCFLKSPAFSSVTGKAKGTPIIKPGNPVNTSTCLNNCHATVKKLYSRGGHTSVNCASCHEGLGEHSQKPSEQNRPITRFAHEACGQCHVNEYKSMMSNKYHNEWAKRNPDLSYLLWTDPGSGTFSRIQGRAPRFHASLLNDLAVNRTAGRFKFKDGEYGWNKVGGRLWDVVYDAHPEDGDQIKIYDLRTAFRPHKGGPPFSRSTCMSCKTGEQILEWPYMGTPNEKAKFNRATAPYTILKAVNYSVTCNICHDPHSAEPRVIRDSFIRALADPEFKDNVYQSDPNRTKIEVIDMGERGFVRKIAILEKYDSKLQCGQCHCNTDNGGEFSVENDKLISATAVDNMNITPMMGPFEYLSYYEKRGWYNSGKHPDTDARLVSAGHPNVEILSMSKHGKAGLGCTDCHYAKETDAKTQKTYKSHQASLPLYKIQQTCLNAGCHGKGSKQNWKEEDALYNIKIIQHLQRKRLAELEFNLNRIIAGIVAAQRVEGIDKAAIEKAQNAHTKANAILTYWASDYSDGLHNPELSEKSLTKAIQEAQVSYGELNKALKEKGAAK